LSGGSRIKFFRARYEGLVTITVRLAPKKGPHLKEEDLSHGSVKKKPFPRRFVYRMEKDENRKNRVKENKRIRLGHQSG